MELAQQLRRQRVKYIVSSYRLEGQEPAYFEVYLERLFQNYPTPLIELALVETLVDQWLSIPMVRGLEFLTQAHQKLKTWEQEPITSSVTPDQFFGIVGLDPSPIFGFTVNLTIDGAEIA